MYKLELDMLLCFVPMMETHGRGIAVTRSLELPFAPVTGMLITGFALNGRSDPMGYKIEDVTWDLDREVFLGTTSLTIEGTPIAFIPLEIRDWIDRDWRFGSFEDAYEQEAEAKAAGGKPIEIDWDWHDEDEASKWSTMSPKARPAAFNALMSALVREMASSSTAWATAYAMDRTKMLFHPDQLKTNDSRPAKKFKDALSEYDRMSFDEQFNWRQKAVRKRPSLAQFFL